MWWRDGVLYQVYPRSFADSDGDGIGDLRGITAHLDHLEWLGVDGLWLNPTFPSPNADWGFDVSDYCGVHPELGTLEDLDELVARAGERGIRVLLDLVPNHTSDQHPWFRERRDFYVWREGRNGGPPNNWKSNFGGPGVDARRGQRPVVPAQLHARSARPRLVERGRARRVRRHPALLDGPRHRGLSHRRRARDRQGPRAARQPAGHRGRHRAPPLAGPAPRVLDEPRGGPRRLPPLARGGAIPTTACCWARRGCSTSSASCASTARTSTSCTWPSTSSSCSPTSRRRSWRRSWPRPRRCCPSTRGRRGRSATTTWSASRRAGRAGTPGSSRCALMLLLTLRGTPVLYYGDELAMPDAEIPPERIVDPVGLLNDPELPGPRRRALADAVERRAGRGLQRARRRALAALRRARRGQRGRPARRPRLRR